MRTRASDRVISKRTIFRYLEVCYGCKLGIAVFEISQTWIAFVRFSFIHKQPSADTDEDEDLDDGDVDPIDAEVREPEKTVPCSSCPEMFEDMGKKQIIKKEKKETDNITWEQ